MVVADQNGAMAVAGDGEVYSDYSDIIKDISADAVVVCKTLSFLKPNIVKTAARLLCPRPD